MQLIFRRRYCHRSLEEATTKWVRDRGLDHAVEREKNLKPLLNIKNLIKSEPSKSLPINIIAQQKESLKIPIRPIDFIRKYPSVFHEFLPGNISIHPHIKLTPEVLNLDDEEQLVYQSHTYKQLVADRLVKLLMIMKINEIPLRIIEALKWDLGIPGDYAETIVPEFPDYFRIVGEKLELVCWSNELAVSVVEKKAVDRENIVFPMKFSSGIKMGKKMKKELDNWQKLSYISPYENASHLLVNSDESDKWAVAVLHELLNLFGGKKVERDNVLCLGEYLGIRSRFKRVLVGYPGIFYVSSKIGTYTAVLRDGYKRGTVIESDSLMNVRSQYIHLMNRVKEEKKVVALQSGSKQQEKVTSAESKSEGDGEVVGGEAVEDDGVELNDLSGGEDEGVSDDEIEVDKEEGMQRGAASKNGAIRGRRSSRTNNFDKKGAWRSLERGKSRGKPSEIAKEEVIVKYSRRRGRQDENAVEEAVVNYPRRRGKQGENAVEEAVVNYPRRRGRQGENSVEEAVVNYQRRRGRQAENAKEEAVVNYPGRRGRQGENAMEETAVNYSRRRGRQDENAVEEAVVNYPRRRGRQCENAKEEAVVNYPRRRESRAENNARENANERVEVNHPRRKDRRAENNAHGYPGERFNSNRSRRSWPDKKISV